MHKGIAPNAYGSTTSSPYTFWDCSTVNPFMHTVNSLMHTGITIHPKMHMGIVRYQPLYAYGNFFNHNTRTGTKSSLYAYCDCSMNYSRMHTGIISNPRMHTGTGVVSTTVCIRGSSKSQYAYEDKIIPVRVL